MSTSLRPRRSSRNVRRTSVEQKSSDDEEDNDIQDLESSGSDFEEQLKKENELKRSFLLPTKKSRGHEEKFSSSSSSSSSDDEKVDAEELEDLGVKGLKKTNKLSKSFARKRSLMKTMAALANHKGKKKTGVSFTSSATQGPSLALSESSSSEADVDLPEETGTRPKVVIHAPKKSPCKKKREDENEQLVVLASQQLDALASTSSAASNQPWVKLSPSETSRPHNVELERAKQSFDLEIAEVLAMGEQQQDEDFTDVESVEGEGSEVKGEPNVLGNIEVTVALPDQQKRKKKKSFDVEAYVKREIAKVRRETQLVMHKTHFLCLVAHLRYINSVLTESLVLKGVALSIVPLAHLSAIEASATALKISQLLIWFRSTVTSALSRGAEASGDDVFPARLNLHLLHRFDTLTTNFPEDLVQMFLLLLRSLGLQARLVLNLNTVSLKPDPKEFQVKTEKTSAEAKKGTSQGKQDQNKKDSSPTKEVKVKDEPGSSSRSSRDATPSKTPSKSAGVRSEKKSSKAKSLPSPTDAKEQAEVTAKKNSTSEGRRTSLRSSRRSGTSGQELRASSKKKDQKEESDPETANAKKRTPKAKSRSESGVNRNSPPRSRSNSTRRAKSSASRKSQAKSRKESSSEEISDSSDDEEVPKVRSKSQASRQTVSAAKKMQQAKSKSRGTTEDQKDPKKSEKKKRPTVAAQGPSQRSPQKREKRKTSGSPSRRNRARSRSSGDEFEPKPKMVKKQHGSTPKQKVTKRPVDYWLEVLIKGDWVCVDVISGKSDCAAEMEARASQPMLYVLAIDSAGAIKDVTKRYAAHFLTQTRKRRVDERWVRQTLSPFAPADAKADAAEDRKLALRLEKAPLPTTISAFKDHPLYALPRHLLKFEAIYPPDAPTLGFLKNEPVYPRECVHTLQSRVTWLKEGRNVKIGQEPYKIVTARPKWDRMSGTVVKDQPLEVFGRWQTEVYTPPPVKDGKVPRNEYGNVELFKPWMLPKGAVHIPIQGLNRIAKKLNIDCAPAMMGWDYHAGGCHPVFDGFVICQEFEDKLMDAWNADVEEKAAKAVEKREKRILDNWRKLTKGLLIANKIKAKYFKKDA